MQQALNNVIASPLFRASILAIRGVRRGLQLDEDWLSEWYAEFWSLRLDIRRGMTKARWPEFASLIQHAFVDAWGQSTLQRRVFLLNGITTVIIAALGILFLISNLRLWLLVPFLVWLTLISGIHLRLNLLESPIAAVAASTFVASFTLVFGPGLLTSIAIWIPLMVAVALTMSPLRPRDIGVGILIATHMLSLLFSWHTGSVVLFGTFLSDINTGIVIFTALCLVFMHRDSRSTETLSQISVGAMIWAFGWRWSYAEYGAVEPLIVCLTGSIADALCFNLGPRGREVARVIREGCCLLIAATFSLWTLGLLTSYESDPSVFLFWRAVFAVWWWSHFLSMVWSRDVPPYQFLRNCCSQAAPIVLYPFMWATIPLLLSKTLDTGPMLAFVFLIAPTGLIVSIAYRKQSTVAQFVALLTGPLVICVSLAIAHGILSHAIGGLGMPQPIRSFGEWFFLSCATAWLLFSIMLYLFRRVEFCSCLKGWHCCHCWVSRFVT